MDPRAVSRFCWLLLGAVLTWAKRGAAEERLTLGIEARAGTASAPYVTRAFPQASGYGASLQLFAKWQLASEMGFWLRAPYALMRVEQPAGAFYDEAAFGNPELGVRVERALSDSLVRVSRAGLDLALALPLAEHDSRESQLEGRALTLANAFSGLSEPELYTPGVVALTPAVFVSLTWPRLSLRGSLKLPLLARLSRANLPSDAVVRSFGVTSVFDVEARVAALRWLSLCLEPRLTLREVAVATDSAGPATLLLSARGEVALSSSFSFALAVHVPVAGPLRSTVAGGLSVQAKF